MMIPSVISELPDASHFRCHIIGEKNFLKTCQTIISLSLEVTSCKVTITMITILKVSVSHM